MVGYDALAVYVHKDNPLAEITLDQLADIYVKDGKMTAGRSWASKIPGRLGRRRRPRQPPVELRHLRVLPRARAR